MLTGGKASFLPATFLHSSASSLKMQDLMLQLSQNLLYGTPLCGLQACIHQSRPVSHDSHYHTFFNTAGLQDESAIRIVPHSISGNLRLCGLWLAG